jgi:hypothetical protein
MIPHHINAVNMAKLTLKTVAEANLQSAMDDEGFVDLLYGIINGQNFQIHQMNAYLGAHENGAVTLDVGPHCDVTEPKGNKSKDDNGDAEVAAIVIVLLLLAVATTLVIQSRRERRGGPIGAPTWEPKISVV